jgi:PAS domain S-box-containing protein
MSELENLRSSEERYRAFVQLSSEGIWCCELEQPISVDLPEDEQIDRYYEQGFLVECNDAMAKMYGLQSAADLLGARLSDLLPRADPANVEYLRAFIRSGYRLADAESHEVSSDGASIYFLNNLTGVVQDGLLLRAWGVQRDITEQKRVAQTEQSLRESEERFQLATRVAGIGTFDWHVPTGQVIWSDQEALLFGLEPGEFDGTTKSWAQRVLPEDLPEAQAHFRSAMDRGAAEINFAFRIRKPDQSIRWLEGVARFLYAEDGSPLRMVGVNFDATERRQMDCALRESEARFRTMADSAPVFIWIADTAKKCVWFNRPWLEFRGRSLEQEAGNGWAEGVHPEDFDRCLKTYAEGFDARQSFKMEYRLQRADGEWRWILDHGIPRHSADGEFAGYIGSCVDITEQKELEQELHQRLQELAEADRHKDEFLAMLSHELRNPLAGIANATYLLDRNGSTPSQLGELRSLIQRQTGYLSRLVDDLLDVSRLTRGLVELQLTTVDLRAVVEQAVDAGRAVVESRRHRLILSLPETPLPMRADPIRVEQIVLNLLFNAAKYTEPGGQVWVEIERIVDTAVIRVRDTGVGIAPELLRRVFDLFTQADKSYARTHGGLGIGLALVQRLVLLHGGEVEARSAGLGRGSEFEVRLPLSPGVLPAAVPAVSFNGIERHRRVLIIEDDRDAAETLGEILALSGHEVALAFTGPQGLEKAYSFQPEVILCDIGLPGLDGWAVARQLRATPEMRDTRLVALTGFGLPDDRRRTFEAGFDRHLTKPVDLPELERLVVTI